MKKVWLVQAAVLVAGLLLPVISFAAAAKTLTGVVVGFNGNQIIFATTSAAKYTADPGSSQLLRKNGAPMQLSEILVGDKIEVQGTLWNDNSISPTSIRDLSLYAHTGTFTGKISAINTVDSSFIIDSKTYGSQTIHTNNFTSYKKNGSMAAFKDLILGMTAQVKGMWDRSNVSITATAVNGSYRLINIYFTGSLSQKNGAAFTVIGNGNVIYGVDVSGAALQNKSGQVIQLSTFNLGDSLRVWGKHLSGSVAIVGTQVKDSSVTK